jgi:hypothetical protein
MSDTVLLVPRPVLYILALFDGEHSVEEVSAEFARATGQPLPKEKVEEMVATLDEALFLDNERFAEVRERIVRDFHASDRRPAMHAGLSYPRDPRELARTLGDLFGETPSLGQAQASAGDPGPAPDVPGPDGAAGGAGRPADIEAIVAPHIDLGRGGACYAAIYRDLALHARARRFVVLGISHHPLRHAFALTTKDYDTPLGRARTDRGFVERLAAACHTDFLADEIAHREEHSVEFQVLFLQYLLGGYTGLCGKRDFTVVPILCASLHDQVERGTEPDEAGEVAELLGALGSMLDNREDVCLIAAVDFAHLGRQFGQELDLTDAFIRDAEIKDRRMMDVMTGRDATGFFRLIADEKDGRNVCGVPAIYALLRLIGAGEAGVVKHYGQAADRKAHSMVTFAGLAYPRRPAT